MALTLSGIVGTSPPYSGVDNPEFQTLEIFDYSPSTIGKDTFSSVFTNRALVNPSKAELTLRLSQTNHVIFPYIFASPTATPSLANVQYQIDFLRQGTPFFSLPLQYSLPMPAATNDVEASILQIGNYDANGLSQKTIRLYPWTRANSVASNPAEQQAVNVAGQEFNFIADKLRIVQLSSLAVNFVHAFLAIHSFNPQVTSTQPLS